MTPIFLPHTLLDAVDDDAAILLPPDAQRGRRHLRALRDKALDKGAYVFLLAWPATLNWAVLAVETPHDAAINDPSELIPQLLNSPYNLAEVFRRANQGEHLAWIELKRHAVKPIRH